SVQFLGEGDSTTDTITVETLDGTTQIISLTINGTNDAPVVNFTETVAVDEDASVNGTVAGNVTDVDAGASLSYALTGAIPTGLSMNADGSYTFDASSYDSLAEGETSVVTASYEVSDGHGGTATGSMEIIITGTNDAPVVSAVETNGVNEGATVSGTVADNVTDVDASDSLSYALTGTIPTGLTMNADGSYTFDASSYDSLADGDSSVVTASYEVSDGHGGTATGSMEITITGTEGAPVITGPTTGTVQEDVIATASGLLTATDPDVGESGFTAATVVGTYGSLTIDGTGNWTYTLDDSSVQFLGEGDSTTDT
ncbi:hypothetical protein EKD02_09860, partial [Chlorobium phaeovibrioides]